MEKLSPFMWLLAILAAYAAVGMLVVGSRAFLRSGAGWRGGVLAGAWVALLQFAMGPYTAAHLLIDAGISLVIVVLYRFLSPPAKPMDRKAVKEDTRQTYLHLVLFTGAVLFMVPFLWLLSTSLKDDEDIFTEEIHVIPQRPETMMYQGKKVNLVRVEGTADVPGQTAGTWAKTEDHEDNVVVRPVLSNGSLGPARTLSADIVKKIKKPGIVWENYPDSLQYLPEETHYGLVYLGNTLLVTGLSIIGTLLTASMVAFAFARLRWPGRDALFLLLLSTMMLPAAVTLIPQFLIWQRLGYVDTLVPLWAGAFLGGGAFNIFLLRQFFMTIPTELEEAAKLDGCGYWRTFWTVMMPLVKPALATVAIMTFMGSWNNFLGPLIYISSPTHMPLAYALQLYNTAHGAQFGYLMAASTMVMLPVLAVFFFCQRYFIQGITLTGLKG